jgi:hypothetical protein
MDGDSSKRLKIILLNAPLLLVIVIFLVSGIIFRLKNEFWSEMIGSGPRLYYNIIATLVICYALLVSVGILRMKEWGRILALSLYFIVAFMFIGSKIIMAFLSPIIFKTGSIYSLLWRNEQWYPEYGVGFYALIMVFFLLRKQVKMCFDTQGF